MSIPFAEHHRAMRAQQRQQQHQSLKTPPWGTILRPGHGHLPFAGSPADNIRALGAAGHRPALTNLHKAQRGMPPFFQSADRRGHCHVHGVPGAGAREHFADQSSATEQQQQQQLQRLYRELASIHGQGMDGSDDAECYCDDEFDGIRGGRIHCHHQHDRSPNQYHRHQAQAGHTSVADARLGAPLCIFEARWLTGVFEHPLVEDAERRILTHPKIKAARKPHGLSRGEAIRVVIDSVRRARMNAGSALAGDTALGFMASSRISPSKLFSAADFGADVFLPTSELPALAFNDIDATVFAGVLRGNVILRADTLDKGVDGRTTVPGGPGNESTTRPLIEVSRKFEGLRGAETGLLDALLHQMIHAFLLRICVNEPGNAGDKENKKGKRSGGKKEGGEANDRGSFGAGPQERIAHALGHDETFEAIAHLIFNGLLGRKHPYPALLGTSNPLLHKQRAGDREGGGSSRDAFTGGLRNGRTHCLPLSPGIGAAAVQGRMTAEEEMAVPKLKLDKKCPVDKNGIPRPMTQYLHHFNSNFIKFVPYLRIDATPALGSYIEIVHADRAVAFPQQALHHAPSLRARGSGSTSRLEIPGTNPADMCIVHDFLSNGRYAEPIDPIRHTATSGPPLIPLRNMPRDLELAGPSAADGWLARRLDDFGLVGDGCHDIGMGYGGDAYHSAYDMGSLLLDVRAARLGGIMSLRELQEHALHRLEAHAYVREDPLDVLEEAYFGDEMEQRAAAAESDGRAVPPGAPLRQWISRWLAHCALPGHPRHPWTACVTNFHVIRYFDETRQRLAELKGRGGPIVVDLDAVERHVVGEERGGRGIGAG